MNERLSERRQRKLLTIKMADIKFYDNGIKRDKDKIKIKRLTTRASIHRGLLRVSSLVPVADYMELKRFQPAKPPQHSNPYAC